MENGHSTQLMWHNFDVRAKLNGVLFTGQICITKPMVALMEIGLDGGGDGIMIFMMVLPLREAIL